MCKVNRYNKIESLLRSIIKEDPSLEDECKDFLTRMNGKAIIDATFPPYQQVIYKIYGPNYPSNEINIQEIKTLIDSVSNSTLRNQLYNRLKEKESKDAEYAKLDANTSRNANNARNEANRELMENLNSINNIKLKQL